MLERKDSDRELLAAYTGQGSEEAFATLTRRYLDLVFSAALRQVQNAEVARDVTQAVFLLLARKAKMLGPEIVVAGWLHKTARFVAREALRSEKRRKLREENMAGALHEGSSPEEVWKQVAPCLDEAMDELSDADRNAVLLRYFQERPIGELAQHLGTSEEAAKKRVSRALDKLRAVLARKGIRSSSALLGTALAASAVQSTPAAIATVVLPGVGGLGTTAALSAKILAKGTMQMITYTKLQSGAAALVVVLMLASTSYVGVQHIRAKQQLDASRAADTANPPLGTAVPTDTQRQNLAAAEQENAQLRAQSRELYRLRDDITQLRGQLRGSVTAARNSAQNPIRDLKESAERLRELEYEYFVSAGQKAITLQPLSEQERNGYAFDINVMKNLGLALRIYASNHGDEFPDSMETLLSTDLLDDHLKQEIQTGKYEYTRFAKAESKPGLPAVWYRNPDQRGIRALVLNDGSAHLIREPAGVAKPGVTTPELSGH